MRLDNPTFTQGAQSLVSAASTQGDSYASVPLTSLDVKPPYRAVSQPTTTFNNPVTRRQFLGLSSVATMRQSVPFENLSPSQRIGYLLRKNPGELLMFAVGAVGSVYVLMRAGTVLNIDISIFSKAFAQDGGIMPTISTTRDGFDWLVGSVMSLAFLICLILTFFARSEKKIEMGSGMAKMLAGFLAGFLTSKGS